MNVCKLFTMALLLLLPTSVCAQRTKKGTRPKTSVKSRQKPKATTVKPQLPTVDLAAELARLSESMVKIEGGKFTMGATEEQNGMEERNEQPTHKVKVGTFYLSRYEVTQALWIAVMKTNPSFFKDVNRPVECVSWDDCQKFIQRLNQLTGKQYRFPTEAEWEYAARGGSKGQKTVFAGDDDPMKVAWFDENSEDSTHVVGLKSPNSLGLYDLSGNVWEWCANEYDLYTKNDVNDTPTDAMSGSGLRSARVIRGGGWNRPFDVCRVSKRDNFGPDMSNFSIGLRLAATEP